MIVQLRHPAEPCGCCVPSRDGTARAKTIYMQVSGFRERLQWHFLLDMASREFELHVLGDEDLNLPEISVELMRI